MRYKLTLEYDGSHYAGWQKQKNARTVQGILISALQQVLGNDPEGRFGDLQGAGRTDAGVHAYGQVAHLEAETSLSPAQLQQDTNQILPAAINILHVETADPRFHARHWADSRQYLYRISRRRNAFEKKYLCWIQEDLDLTLMQKAAQAILGLHDFSSFSSKPAKEKSTQVQVEALEIWSEGDLILIRIRASHFLWNMVRNLVGVLIEIGKGQMPPETIAQALKTYLPELRQHRAPAAGLFLERVEYPQR